MTEDDSFAGSEHGTEQILALMAELEESGTATFSGLRTSDDRTWLDYSEAQPAALAALRSAFPDLPLVPVPPEVVRREGELRLGLLRAQDLAVSRHHEVLNAVVEAETRADAVTAVRELLDLDEMQADVVLSLRWEQLTKDERTVLSADLAAQAAALDHGEHPDPTR